MESYNCLFKLQLLNVKSTSSTRLECYKYLFTALYLFVNVGRAKDKIKLKIISRKRHKDKFVWEKTYKYIPLVWVSIHCESKIEK